MKIKNGFVKKEIAGSEIVVPVGVEAQKFNGMITLGGPAGFFWDCFQNDITIDDAVKLVTDEYDIDADTARKDLEGFVKMLEDNNLLK